MKGGLTGNEEFHEIRKKDRKYYVSSVQHIGFSNLNTLCLQFHT